MAFFFQKCRSPKFPIPPTLRPLIRGSSELDVKGKNGAFCDYSIPREKRNFPVRAAAQRGEIKKKGGGGGEVARLFQKEKRHFSRLRGCFAKGEEGPRGMPGRAPAASLRAGLGQRHRGGPPLCPALPCPAGGYSRECCSRGGGAAFRDWGGSRGAERCLLPCRGPPLRWHRSRHRAGTTERSPGPSPPLGAEPGAARRGPPVPIFFPTPRSPLFFFFCFDPPAPP